MDKLTSLCYLFLISSLISCCTQPTDFEGGKFVAHTPEDVVANLSQAYEEKNLDGYLSMFSEDCQFLYGSDYLWGKSQEQRVHQMMFAAAKDIELKLTEAWNEEATKTIRRTVYHYYLQVQLDTRETLEAQGQVEMGFAKTPSDIWQIQSFRELKTALEKWGQPESINLAESDSVNYFPLRVGNEWVYVDQINPSLPDFQVSVTDSAIIRGNLYYYLDLFPFVTRAFYRVDSLQQLNLFTPEDSSELTIYNFNAEIGDSLIVQLSGDDFPMIVELISRKDSLTVPAGTFADVLEFLITDFNSGSRFFYEFAAEIGMLRQRGHNQQLVLKSAFVNGEVIVSVEALKYNWTKIKMSF